MLETYAFVFARGGSKGLANKNIRPLGGTPLIVHSIQVAQAIPAVSRVYVSTDSGTIADIAQEAGARIIRRPAPLATDTAPEWAAWQHAVDYLLKTGEQFNTFLSLPATSPLRSTNDVENCLDALDEDTDVVITATPAVRHPCFNMIYRDENGESRLIMGDGSVTRRQDTSPAYDITTVAYATRPEFIINNSGIFSGRVKSVIIPRERAVDIDDEFDFLIAEALYHYDNVN
jgi:CMP-N-acetylneuraminic acid synthetase